MPYPSLSQSLKKNWKALSLLLLVLFGALFYVFAKPKSTERPVVPDPAFAAFVSGYTGGVISRNHVIAIKLAQPPLKEVTPGRKVKEAVLSFSPSLKGDLVWKDQRTLEFSPSEPMESGKIYTATLNLNKVIKIEEEKFNDFVFGFQVIPQSFEVQTIGLRAAGEEGYATYQLEGRIITADEAEEKGVEKMLKASLAGKELPITWSHTSKEHTFIVKDLTRSEKEQILKLSWSGKEIDVSKKGESEVIIPAKGSFQFLTAFVEETTDAPAHFFFSDPLDERQSFEGLVRIDSMEDLTFSVKGNELVVFTNQQLKGSREIQVFQGIKNSRQQAIKSDTSFTLEFKDLNPAVKFVGKGNILASSEGLILPIEAVNLKTIQIRVIRIFQDRVGQFLQFNDLDGSSQLNRVGRPVLQKVIRLDDKGVEDLGKWNRFTLELSKLIEAEPGAIYQIAIGFNKNDIISACAGLDPDDGLRKIEDDREEMDFSNFDGDSDYFYDGFGQYYDEDYNWQMRNDPCNSAYYSGDRNVIKKNILATDIGLIAKRGTNNQLLFIATDLVTAEPMSGVQINIYNYQLQKLATSSTDNKGMVSFNMKEKAFFAEAIKGDQYNYLKLTEGNALSVSQFDVSGDPVQQGIKGFLYGERGVWRPGDSIYLSFMLEDKIDQLPLGHPIVFELSNPRGMLVQKIVRTVDAQGLYSFATATAPDALTGNWKAEVKVGGATFTKMIKVETVKPNRLKVNLKFPNDQITPENQSGQLDVSWLTGASAGNLRAEFELILSQAKTKIKGFEQYQFDDPATDFETINRLVFEGNLNPQGHAVINPSVSLGAKAPGTLNAYFKGRVFEPGGDFSVSYQSVPYYAYSQYVGLKVPKGSGYGDMLDVDKKYSFELVSVNADGKLMNTDQLEVRVYKTQWRWWWEESEGNGADFANNKYYKEVMQKQVPLKNGKGSFSFQAASSEWGRYYIRVTDPKTGYTSGSFIYFEWPSYGGSSLEGMPGGATRLAFTSEKESYKVGEKMKLFIPGSSTGKILISVENGSRIIETYWMDMKKGTNEFSIPIIPEMTPNIYVHVSEIQPHAQTINDLPIRQYGIVSVKVEDPTTILKPQINMPEQLRPEEKVTIRVSEQYGKAMSYILAIVDEGLLDLTNFKTPDPWKAFYAKEALGVTTWDVYDQVIGAYGAKLERLLSIGGDGEITEENPQSQSLRFKPVVKFFGPFTLEKGKTATHSFIMPNYVGSVRTMVVACKDGAYGNTEKATPVKQPLMILSTLPRVAGPMEEISLPVNIFAMEKGVRDVTLKVTVDQQFSIVGSATSSFHFDQPGNGLVEFHLKVNEMTGPGKVKVEASSGQFKASSEIDLTVRNPNAPQTQVLTKMLQAGESWEPEISFFGIKGTNTAQLEVSALPPLNLGKRINDLLVYPHGCVEQRTSIAFPQLYLPELIPLSEEQKKQTKQNVEEVIRSLSNYQHSSGGFVYWPGSNYTDDWASSYAGHFLLEARKKGYQVLDGMIDKWINFQNNRANSWKPQSRGLDDLVQAYRLYTLALAQQPNWSAMNRMNGLQELSVQARWRLANAYVLAGREDVAKNLIEGANVTVTDYRSLSYTYGSGTRDEAMILQTLTDMKSFNEGFTIAKRLSDQLNTNEWMSTQEAAFSLVALSGFYSHQQQVKEINYTYQLNGKAAVSQKTKLPQSSVALSANAGNPNFIVKNTSGGTLYANVVISGTPATGKEVATENHLNMQVSYLMASGRPVDPSHLKQGTDFIAEVTIHNPGTQGDYKNMALTQIFPSGWEIRNTRFEGTSAVYERSVPDYQDIRDDRVYTYFDLEKGKSKTFRILLSATYAGKFYLPSVNCAAMYDNRIISVKPGKWVEVEKR